MDASFPPQRHAPSQSRQPSFWEPAGCRIRQPLHRLRFSGRSCASVGHFPHGKGIAPFAAAVWLSRGQRNSAPARGFPTGTCQSGRMRMSRGFPSMTALLGILAVAGYQNRDKLAEMFAGMTSGNARAPGAATPPQGQTGGLGDIFGAGSIGSVLSGGLRDLVERFRQAGQGETADSWVAHGPNRAVAPDQLESAIGADTLEALTKQTGLSREEILSRLTRELPNAVDKYTPEGRLPTEDGVQRPV